VSDNDIVTLRIPCQRRILTRLQAGLPVFSIRLERIDGDDPDAYSLIVHGITGPLSDPFEEDREPPPA
jgi:hypothetical protein